MQSFVAKASIAGQCCSVQCPHYRTVIRRGVFAHLWDGNERSLCLFFDRDLERVPTKHGFTGARCMQCIRAFGSAQLGVAASCEQFDEPELLEEGHRAESPNDRLSPIRRGLIRAGYSLPPAADASLRPARLLSKG